MTKIINLCGGPGVGKSTTAAGLFFALKERGVKCELVTEYAKDRVYEGHLDILEDQVGVFGVQYRRLERLKGKVDLVITDSPLFLATVYGESRYKAFKDLVMEICNTEENTYYYLTRKKMFHAYGRIQKNKKECEEIDLKILKTWEEMKHRRIFYNTRNASKNVTRILTDLEKRGLI